MEREIRFRGKTKDGEWLHGNLVQFDGMCSVVSQKVVESTPLDFVGAAIVKGIVDKDTLGQYIGLEDIFGAMIFEGDIISIDGCWYIVEFCENEWIFKNSDDEIYEICELDFENAEVIGNIYDDSELIDNTPEK